MFLYTEKYNESEYQITNDNLLYTTHNKCQSTFDTFEVFQQIPKSRTSSTFHFIIYQIFIIRILYILYILYIFHFQTFQNLYSPIVYIHPLEGLYLFICIYVLQQLFIYLYFLFIYIYQYLINIIYPQFNETTNTHEFVPLKRHEFVI